MASWSKLKSGDWGIRITETVKIGDKVNVQKKSGEVQTVTISKIVWTDGKVSLCAIVPPERAAGDRVCAECGRGGALVSDLEDGMMKHYNCCDIPPS